MKQTSPWTIAFLLFIAGLFVWLIANVLNTIGGVASFNFGNTGPSLLMYVIVAIAVTIVGSVIAGIYTLIKSILKKRSKEPNTNQN